MRYYYFYIIPNTILIYYNTILPYLQKVSNKITSLHISQQLP